MRDVVIAGVGSTEFGRFPHVPIEALGVKAAAHAILDAEIDRQRVGALYVGNFLSGTLNGKEVLAGLVGEQLGLGNIPCTKVEGACASGGIAFRHAWMAIASGMCDIALAVGVETMSHAATSQVTGALNCAMDNENDGPTGLTFPGLFGLAWRAYEHLYGVTRGQLSAVVRKNKAYGLRNPLAHMGASLSDEQIADSALICDPLRLFDCCSPSDGAAAIVLAAKSALPSRRGHHIDVLATVQTRGSATVMGHPNLTSFDATVSAACLAYERAKVRPNDIDVVELHDCFSIAEVIDSEDLGIVPRGRGAVWAAEGRTTLGGNVAINPSGGLLAKGHPVGASGIGQIYEVVQQLRGKHPNQVRDARLGMTHSLGGTGVACTVSILRRSET